MENIIEERKHPKNIGRYILLSIVIFVIAYFVVLPNIKNKSITQDEILTATQKHTHLKKLLAEQEEQLSGHKTRLVNLEQQVTQTKSIISGINMNIVQLDSQIKSIEDALCNLRKVIGGSCTGSIKIDPIYFEKTSGTITN